MASRGSATGFCAAVVLVVLSWSANASADVCPGTGTQPLSCHSLRPASSTGGVQELAWLTGYAPLQWEAAAFAAEPGKTSNDGKLSEPGLVMTTGAGAWGTGGGEPMVLASQSFQYVAAEGADYLTPALPSRPWRFPCDADHPMCTDRFEGASYLTARTAAFNQRSYRIEQVNPASLPDDVKAVPVLVDYHMVIQVKGQQELADGSYKPGAGANAQVTFGNFEQLSGGAWVHRGQYAVCRALPDGVACEMQTPDGKLVESEPSGTLRREVLLKHLSALSLRLSAEVWRDVVPDCRERLSVKDEPCAVQPWTAEGTALADPFVYIDPDWEYADWFKLEMAVDETDTVWIEPRRTPVDPETLQLTDDVASAGQGPGGGTSGSSNAGGARPGGDHAGGNASEPSGARTSSGGEQGDDAPNTGGADSTAEPESSDDSGCACRFTSTRSPAAATWLLLALALAGLKLRHRRRAM